MNENLKELAEQAKKYARDYVAECNHYGYYMEQDEYELRREQKFAELIIRECAKFLDDNSGYDDVIGVCFLGPEELLQHFGIDK